jgi:hypothetical protein
MSFLRRKAVVLHNNAITPDSKRFANGDFFRHGLTMGIILPVVPRPHHGQALITLGVPISVN